MRGSTAIAAHSITLFTVFQIFNRASALPGRRRGCKARLFFAGRTRFLLTSKGQAQTFGFREILLSPRLKSLPYTTHPPTPRSRGREAAFRGIRLQAQPCWSGRQKFSRQCPSNG